MGLTVKQIAKLKGPGRYGDGHGLALQITPAGVKSWVLRFQRNGVERWMGLGPLHTFTLEEARERARKARQLLADDIDPLDAKHAERESKRREEKERAAEEAKRKTFSECAEAFLKKHSDGWKNAKHRWQWASTLKTYANPVLGNLYVSDIDTPHIVQVLERDDLWTTKRETARRVLGRIERVLNYAKASGYRSGDNPAAWSGHLKDLLPSNGTTVEHHAALPYADLPAFLIELREREGTAARALEFTILTAARTGETIGARWEEIDLKAKTWTVPADRMKGGKEHKVPLPDRALAILRSLPHEDGNPFLFIGPKQGLGLSNMGMDAVLRRMGFKDRATVHGFRSTFRDWVGDCTSYPNHVAEQALAHAISSAVEKAYRRSDLFEKRRRLMAEWSRYCASTPAAATAMEEKKVIPIRKASST